MRFRVVCGRGETIASFSPTRRFSRVDFPALGRPMSDTNPARPAISILEFAEPSSEVPGADRDRRAR
jgi:hypothetical protein